MLTLAFDTATPDTVVGLRDGDATAEARVGPADGRPQHGARLLALAVALLADRGAVLADVGRLGVGTGPGSFTGLRIGVATGRALAQATGAELVAVGTLEALADAAREDGHAGPVLAVLDARRREAFAGAWAADGAELIAPRVLDPAGLGDLLDADGGPWLAVGDGAIAFGAALMSAAVRIPEPSAGGHHVRGAALCRLAERGTPGPPDVLRPTYLRAPDAAARRP